MLKLFTDVLLQGWHFVTDFCAVIVVLQSLNKLGALAEITSDLYGILGY